VVCVSLALGASVALGGSSASVASLKEALAMAAKEIKPK
jgi:hypothetical protein